MDKKQTTILRANILGGMNSYVLDVVGDELGTEIWFQCGVPDGADEETLMEIAEDEKEFKRITKWFYHILDTYC